MIRKKQVIFILPVLFSLLFFSGCWGAREPDELAYVLATGIDKGKENIVKVTFEVAVPKAIPGGGGGGEEKPFKDISVEAASLFGALRLGNSFVGRELTLLHNRVVIVSEEIAREGVSTYINPLIRSREIRRNTFILVARGSAANFIKKNQPLIERYPSRQMDFLLDNASTTGFSLTSIINEFTEALKSPGREAVATLVGVNEGREGEDKKLSQEEKAFHETAYLPGDVPRQGGNAVEAIGLAAFRGDKLVGYLDGNQTRYYQMLTGDFETAVFTFPDPRKPEQYIIVLELKEELPPKVKVDLSGPGPKVEVDIILEADILSIQSGINYETGDERERLKHYLEEVITREMQEVIKKSQQEFKSDIFGFGEYTRHYFWTWQDWKEYGWLERYLEAEVVVNTELLFRRPGMMLRTEPITSTQTGGEE